MSPPKRKLPNTFYLSLITVNPSLGVPLYRQIYTGLRDAITDGRLAANTKLPSTRDLVTIWGVSRNTLRNAFDQLIAEGYLEAIVGHGTFTTQQESRPTTTAILPQERERPISQIGRYLEPFGRSMRQPRSPATAFAVGIPGFDIFPHKIWNRIINRCQRHHAGLEMPVNGIRKLRQAIASYLVSARGLHCTAEQIDIVPGSVMGMYITSLALLSPGDQVWMEDPGFINAFGIIQYRGAKVIPIPVDAEGLNVQAGLAQAPNARLAYVTPSHQYPLGVTMSLARRYQLLDWASRQNAWILEDDYDSEFRYDGPPLTALQGLDKNQRVIYCGTFSKVMLPSLRLGYVVLPPDLVDVYTGVKMPLSPYSPLLIQEAMAEFMLEGHFVRHIRHMRQQYQARRDALVAAFERHLSGAVTLGETTCGMHAVGFLAPSLDEGEVVRQAHQLGMAITPLSQEYFATPRQTGIVIGFANIQPEAIDGYIAKLAAAIL
jgi:GntR family transcriptional regulator/MocR family aminotransferase